MQVHQSIMPFHPQLIDTQTLKAGHARKSNSLGEFGVKVTRHNREVEVAVSVPNGARLAINLWLHSGVPNKKLSGNLIDCSILKLFRNTPGAHDEQFVKRGGGPISPTEHPSSPRVPLADNNHHATRDRMTLTSYTRDWKWSLPPMWRTL